MAEEEMLAGVHTIMASPSVFAMAKMPIGDFSVGDRTYRPQSDVTVGELALLLKLFVAGLTPHTNWDFEAFIVEHGLERHWPKTEEITS